MNDILIGQKIEQQKIVDDIVNECRAVMLAMLEATKNEFEERELTDEQRSFFSEINVAMAEKIMQLKLVIG